MITDCFGARQWDLSGTETLFVQGVIVLGKMLLLPVAISVFTWKIRDKGPAHHRTSLLLLDEPAPPDEQDVLR